MVFFILVFLYFGVFKVVVFINLYLLTLSFLLTTLKQRAGAIGKLKSGRRWQSLNAQDIANRQLAVKKHAEGLKLRAEKKAESSSATPTAENKSSASKKRKGASSSEVRRKSARVASLSEKGTEGKKLGSLMEEAADSENDDDDDDDDDKEDVGSKKKRSGKK